VRGRTYRLSWSLNDSIVPLAFQSAGRSDDVRRSGSNVWKRLVGSGIASFVIEAGRQRKWGGDFFFDGVIQ
jgi:hypothetical protein